MKISLAPGRKGARAPRPAPQLRREPPRGGQTKPRRVNNSSGGCASSAQTIGGDIAWSPKVDGREEKI